MIQTIVAAIAFLLAAIWEAHIVSFLPAWASVYPLWPLVVVGLSLESDRVKLMAGLLLALMWQEAARPDSLPPISWLWIPLLFVGAWSLQIWFSHRSTWSAFVVVILGRLVWIIARAIDLSSFHPDSATWKAQLWQWALILLWDAVLVATLLKTVLFFSRRLGPYLPRFARHDQL